LAAQTILVRRHRIATKKSLQGRSGRAMGRGSWALEHLKRVENVARQQRKNGHHQDRLKLFVV
jgi:hypothetical protein